ncbi:MAG: hypothetical protein HY901_10875 [Deltaproteobacteria bacterium]|nr:hypothetical protein [Deltaproteobacteria bacterium]
MELKRLSQVKTALEQALRSAEPWKLSFLITRVALRTGINLSEIREEQERDSAAVSKVLETLKSMGYQLDP